jgi:hypothetical protein
MELLSGGGLVPKSKVNNRAKCLTISQVIKAKLYSLILVSETHSLSFFSSQRLLFGPTTTYASVPILVLT